MPDPTTQYRFYPTVRPGYPPAEALDVVHHTDGVPGGGKLALDFTVRADEGAAEASDTVRLRMYGPGDVTGIDPRQVVRMDPAPGTTDLPPNHFAVVEFDSPYLPWLFSPVRADNEGRTMPWCGLIVLERTDRVRVRTDGTRPCPSIEAPREELPPPHEMWAWAHAQMVGGPRGTDAVRDEALKRSNFTRSRLVSPRNLQPNRTYVAAVVPLFESGRLAGLGRDPVLDEDDDAVEAYAWTPGSPSTVELPVYHHWEFSTSQLGDFEYLVRQLTPRNLNGPEYDIGRRTVDVTDPGPETLEVAPAAPEGHRTVDMEGALRKKGAALGTYAKRDALRGLLNSVDPVTIDGETFEVVGPPVYGEWHAQEFTLTDESGSAAEHPHGHDQWVYDLNLHPGYRIAAAIGGDVIRERQEQLMASAWEQVGQIRETNRLLARAQLSEVVMLRKMDGFSSYPSGWSLQFTAPAHNRLGMGHETAGHHLRASRLPTAVLSAAFRRMTRPSGRLARRLETPFDANESIEALVGGTIEIVPDPGTPDGMQTVEGVGTLAETCEEIHSEAPPTSSDFPEPVQEVLDAMAQMRDLLGFMADLLRTIRTELLGPHGGDSEESERAREQYDDHFRSLLSEVDHFEALLQVLVDRNSELPIVSDDLDQAVKDRIFRDKIAAKAQLADLPSEGEPIEPPDVLVALAGLAGVLDGLDEVERYIFAMEGDEAQYLVNLICNPIPEREEAPPPDVPGVLEALDPASTLIDRMGDRIGGIDLSKRPAPLDRVMVYPRFPQPTYRDLKEQSEDYLLPGVSEIPEDTVGALETNPQFIEAFMVGLNHEMASELLWRRYPTDRRGSYFRQFWDPSAHIPKPDDPEMLKDVTELHTWDDKTDAGNNRLDSPLGSNTTTGAGGADEENEGQTSEPNSNVVIVVRGKLLHRYPTTTIYAAKARYAQAGSEVESDRLRVPKWPSSTQGQIDTPFLRFPIFRGELEPDITFLGFDLSSEEAVGDEPSPSVAEPGDDWVDADGNDTLGWFFVFEEPPGEPRFGIDVDPDAEEPPAGMTYTADGTTTTRTVTGEVDGVEIGWQGLKWGHIPTSDAPPAGLANLTINESRPGTERWEVVAGTEWATGRALDPEMAAVWGKNSAHMAYILWQKPVRIAIHADDLLPTGSAP